MELVPILSTIILVGTIATFILAVAAYILYKIRERRGREAGIAPAYSQPEPHVLVAPQSINIQQGQPAPATMYAAPPAQQRVPQQQAQRPLPQQAGAPSSLFWEYTDEGFVPVNPQEEARRQQAEAQAAAQAQAQAQAEARQQAAQPPQQDEGYAWL